MEQNRSKDPRNTRLHPQWNFTLMALAPGQDLLIVPASCQLALFDFLALAPADSTYEYAGLLGVPRIRETIIVIVATAAARGKGSVGGRLWRLDP